MSPDHFYKPAHKPSPLGHGLGAARSPFDRRDREVAAPPPEEAARLPPKMDLTQFLFGIYDQGQLGSCTANAMSGQYRVKLRIAGKPDFAPARLVLYWMERAIEQTTTQDSGAYPRDGYKAMLHQGLAPEADWPYDVSKFAQQPPQQAFDDAKAQVIASYASITRSITSMKTQLAKSEPFTLGIDVYASFEGSQATRTGVIPMPKGGEELLGGHDILVVGYDDATKNFAFANSWGTGWGDHGLGYLPYAYAGSTTLAFDRWRMELPT